MLFSPQVSGWRQFQLRGAIRLSCIYFDQFSMINNTQRSSVSTRLIKFECRLTLQVQV